MIYEASIGIVLSLLAIYDYRHQAIPRVVWFPLGVVGLARFVTIFHPLFMIPVAISLILAGIAYLGDIGTADIYGIVIGALLVPELWIPALLVSFVIASTIAISKRIQRKQMVQPYFVALSMGYWLVLLWQFRSIFT